MRCLSAFAQGMPVVLKEYEAIYPGMNDVIFSTDRFRFQNKVGFSYNGFDYPAIIEFRKPLFTRCNEIPFLYSDDRKQLIILCDELISICLSPELIFGKETPFFIGIKKNPDRAYELSGAYVRASSVLHEKARSYPPDYLGQIWLERPWSEGVSGYGIGEYLLFKIGTGDDRIGRPIGVYLINGYISFTNPERYTNNGRIKRMTLTSLRTGKSRQFEVQDTPNPQFFPTEDLGGYEFRLTIDDVYPGEKYEDTCVSGLLSLNVSWGGPVPDDFFEVSPLLKTGE